MSSLLLFLFVPAIVHLAEAACPSSYSAADCTDGHGVAICSMSSGEYTCSPNRGNVSSTIYATYDPSHATCAQDYCFFGTDSAGDAFSAAS